MPFYDACRRYLVQEMLGLDFDMVAETFDDLLQRYELRRMFDID